MINKYNYIINSLKLMSLPYDRQILYFPDFADIPDGMNAISIPADKLQYLHAKPINYNPNVKFPF